MSSVSQVLGVTGARQTRMKLSHPLSKRKGGQVQTGKEEENEKHHQEQWKNDQEDEEQR